MLRLCRVLCATFAAATLTQPAFSQDQKPRQLVIVSFDGAHDNDLWEKSRAIGERTGARFTYFLSCTFLMTRDQRYGYRAPQQRAGVRMSDSPAPGRKSANGSIISGRAMKATKWPTMLRAF